jgi:signal transduction histidine kinase
LKYKIKYQYFSILIAGVLFACSSPERVKPPEATKGVIDLRGWDFKVDGPISLNGEWEYYWNKLYKPQDFESVLPKKDGYIKVPGEWFASTSDSRLYTLNGYMTYRLVVITDHLNEQLLLYALRAPATACQVYINDRLVAENGSPGITKPLSHPYGSLYSYPFNYKGDTLKIIVPISNFHSPFDAGLFYEIKLGESKSLSKSKERDLRLVNFTTGLILFIFLYNILIFCLLRDDKAPLYLSLFSICLLISLSSFNGMLYAILPLYPFLYGPVEMIFIYSFLFDGIIAFAYFYALYNVGPKQVRLEKYYISYVIIVLLLLLPRQCGFITNLKYGITVLNTFSNLLIPFFICCLGLVIFAAFKKKNYAYHNIVTVVIFIAVLTITAFYEGSQREIIFFIFGMIVFLTMQTYIISDRFVRTYFANIELKNGLIHLNENLQNLVKERTHQLEEQKEELLQQKEELQSTLENLQKTQEQLVESEKMAAIGGLVAGVAHEMNTPVGIGITAISSLLDDVQKMASLYEKEEISRKNFKGFLESANDTAKLIQKNLERAASLIQSFKQVSTDQVTEQQRVFVFKEYINDILLSLRPKFREKNVDFKIECDDELQLNSYPGVFAQIFTNLLLNSLQHGFFKRDAGTVGIKADISKNLLKIRYTDDGAGINKKDLSHIFEPFYTSDQHRGTGLGLNIIYNLVKQKLHGTITCESEQGKGVLFKIEVPVK